jgi:hypothetical protein
MVRSGAVSHPGDWRSDSGYADLMSMRQRYAVLYVPALMALLGIDKYEQLVTQRQAIECIGSKSGIRKGQLHSSP